MVVCVSYEYAADVVVWWGLGGAARVWGVLYTI